MRVYEASKCFDKAKEKTKQKKKKTKWPKKKKRRRPVVLVPCNVFWPFLHVDKQAK